MVDVEWSAHRGPGDPVITRGALRVGGQPAVELFRVCGKNQSKQMRRMLSQLGVQFGVCVGLDLLLGEPPAREETAAVNIAWVAREHVHEPPQTLVRKLGVFDRACIHVPKLFDEIPDKGGLL